MRLFVSIVGLFLLQVFTACSNQAGYKQIAHSADSLTGALNLSAKQLLSADSVILKKILAKSNDYKSFVAFHFNDTLTKVEADQLQKLIQSSAQLQAFASNRYTLVARINLVGSQLTKLSADAEKKVSDPEVLQGYYQRELTQAQLVVAYANEQLMAYQAAVAEFKSALPGVEALIRKRNRGELPQIINDTLNL